MTAHSSEQVIYEKLWQETTAAFDRGTVRLDPFLANRQSDKRRGVTLLARPTADVRECVKNFLDEMASAAPEQYFYQPSEFHMTVLSVIPGSESWQQTMQRLPDYLATLEMVLKNTRTFSVAFRGVTASSEAVMIQGFPADDTLAQLRDELRAAFNARGLGENLDRRYKLATAHLTVMRFYRPMKNWQPLKLLLEKNRSRDFGTMRFDSFQLIEGNWYASENSVRILREFPLSDGK